jgi:secreted trypsin-like serine protease
MKLRHWHLNWYLKGAIALLGAFSGSVGATESLKSLNALDTAIVNLRSSPTVYAGSPTGSNPDTVTNRVTLANNPKFGGVGSISVNCTGAAISSNHVLSAAHCFNPNSPNVNFTLNSVSYSGVVSIFPGAKFPFDDVAVITLSQSLPNTTPIYELLRQPVALGSKFEFVGFGNSGDGVNGSSGSFDPNVKRFGANTADFFYSENEARVGSFSLTNRTALIGFDFDGTDANTNIIGGLTIGNLQESTYGGGDSGAPNFIDVNGTLKIAGVSTGVLGVTTPNGTFSNPFFGSGGIFTDVSSFAGYIDSIVMPVPFEFSPVLGVGLMGIWLIMVKRNNLK